MLYGNNAKDIIRVDNIIIGAILHHDKTVDIRELENISREAAEIYALAVLKSRCRLLEDGNETDIYKDLILGNEIVYGREEEYFAKLTILNIMEYYEKYGSSDIIEKELYDRGNIHYLIFLSLYYYRSPITCCMSHLITDEDIQGIDGLMKIHDYIFYGIGDSNAGEAIALRMAYSGETQELKDKLCNCNIRSITYSEEEFTAFKFLSYDTLEYIYLNAKRAWIQLICATLLPDKTEFINNVKNKDMTKIGFIDRVAYQLYWKKYMRHIRMPSYEKDTTFTIYAKYYPGTIDIFEDALHYKDYYLESRIRR